MDRKIVSQVPEGAAEILFDIDQQFENREIHWKKHRTKSCEVRQGVLYKVKKGAGED